MLESALIIFGILVISICSLCTVPNQLMLSAANSRRNITFQKIVEKFNFYQKVRKTYFILMIIIPISTYVLFELEFIPLLTCGVLAFALSMRDMFEIEKIADRLEDIVR